MTHLEWQPCSLLWLLSHCSSSAHEFPGTDVCSMEDQAEAESDPSLLFLTENQSKGSQLVAVARQQKPLQTQKCAFQCLESVLSNKP